MAVMVRAFPTDDPEFAAFVEDLFRNVDELTPAIVEDVRQCVRTAYPRAELALQHPLATIAGDRVLYAYRDGTLVSDVSGQAGLVQMMPPDPTASHL